MKNTKSKFDTYNFVIPTWALSALINGDTSGCNDEDIEALDKFETKLKAIRDGRSGHWSIPEAEYLNGDFRAYNDINGWLGCDVVDMVYHVAL